uniref:Uncharacterized protein n=1 Tax=Melopsittacus undulatus TaxID=13146 RepID=A0A8V5GHZ4_MELUD
MELVSTSVGKFTVDLFNNVSSAMALVYLGAKGNTAIEMAEVGEDTHSGFKELLTAINKPRSTYSLKTANRIYMEKLFKKYYKAEPQNVSFKTAMEQSRKEINTWVEKQTEGKIKNLLGPRDVTTSTKLVLVNAVYFKNKTKPVKMMCVRNTFPVLIMETLNIKMIELPYLKHELSMFILLPDDIKDMLSSLQEKLTYEKLSEWTDSKKMTETLVDLYLPNSMGMHSAFSSNADFSGMAEKGDMLISKIIHQSFVAVDEKGTEAAAATATVVLTSAPVGHVLKFKADHPFHFFIRHNKSKSILFLADSALP